jgi:hypothetical protein
VVAEVKHVPLVEFEINETGRRARIIVDGQDWTGSISKIAVEAGADRVTTVQMSFIASIGVLDPQVANHHRLAEVLRIRDELAGAPPVKRARIWAERSLLWALARIR